MHNEIDVDASARKRFERKFGLGIIADLPMMRTRAPRRDNATDTLPAMPPGAR